MGEKIRALSIEEHRELGLYLRTLRKRVKAVPLNLIANNPYPPCLTYFSLADREVDALMYHLDDLYYAIGGALPSPYHGALKPPAIEADIAANLVDFLHELACQGKDLLKRLYMRVPGYVYDLAGGLRHDLVLTSGSYRHGLEMQR
jgi:hypothetical protein